MATINQSLKIAGYKNTSDCNTEYIRLKVLEDCNLNDYAVCDMTYENNNIISNLHRHVYRFPTCQVKKEQSVILFTGKKEQVKIPENFKTALHFYMGLEQCVWNDLVNDKAILWQVNTIQVVKISES